MSGIMDSVKYNEEWVEYYKYLEELRQSGVTNMWGGGAYLQEEFGMSSKDATQILISWMKNYDALVEGNVIERN